MLKRLLFIASTVFILPLVGLPDVAIAAEINTPPLSTGGDRNFSYFCLVTNVGKKDIRNVLIEFIELDGTVTASSSPLTISPGHTDGQVGHGAARLRRCRVSGWFFKWNVIVHLIIEPFGGGVTRVSVMGR